MPTLAFGRLHVKRLSRMSSAWGLNPILGLALVIAALIVAYKGCLSEERVAYALAAITISLASLLRKPEEELFLQRQFEAQPRLLWKLIRIVLLGSPPVFILLMSGHKLLASVTILMLLLSSQWSPRSSQLGRRLKLFQRWPFEFSRGFRQRFLAWPIALGLLLISWRVDNPNLGLFATAIPYLVCLSFYLTVEDSHFVWIHIHTPKQFIKEKSLIALYYSVLTCVPLSIAHSVINPGLWHYNLALTCSGLALVLTAVWAKYAQFPSEVNLLSGLAICFTIAFPPLFIIIGPYLYLKALKNLDPILK